MANAPHPLYPLLYREKHFGAHGFALHQGQVKTGLLHVVEIQRVTDARLKNRDVVIALPAVAREQTTRRKRPSDQITARMRLCCGCQ